jgi:hypothetical protein
MNDEVGGLSQFPISATEARETLAGIAKQIHARYTSPFALVLILPNAIWTGKVLEEELVKDGAHPIVHGIGTMLVDTEHGRKAVVVEPPSVHGIKGKKVVIFDAQGDLHITTASGQFIANMKPQTVEVSLLFCKGEPPPWVNQDYIGYSIDENVLVTGLGLGYNQEQASGASITGEIVEPKPKEEGAGNEVKLEEVEHERS